LLGFYWIARCLWPSWPYWCSWIPWREGFSWICGEWWQSNNKLGIHTNQSRISCYTLNKLKLTASRATDTKSLGYNKKTKILWVWAEDPNSQYIYWRLFPTTLEWSYMPFQVHTWALFLILLLVRQCKVFVLHNHILEEIYYMNSYTFLISLIEKHHISEITFFKFCTVGCLVLAIKYLLGKTNCFNSLLFLFSFFGFYYLFKRSQGTADVY